MAFKHVFLENEMYIIVFCKLFLMWCCFLVLDACKLYCRQGFTYYPKGLVKDGTRCRYKVEEDNDVCIGGKCMVRCFKLSVKEVIFFYRGISRCNRYHSKHTSCIFLYLTCLSASVSNISDNNVLLKNNKK